MWGAIAGRRQREQHAGDSGVDLLVVLDLPVAEVEEASASRCSAARPESRRAGRRGLRDRAAEVGSLGSKTSAKNGSAVGLVLSPVPLVKFAR